MKDYSNILAVDIDKMDRDDVLTFLEAYSSPSRILIHIGLLEKIFEIIGGKDTETRKLLEIVQNAILHCTIAKDNPTAMTYDPITGEAISGPFIFDQEFVINAKNILPLLGDIHKRVLSALNK